MIVEVSGSAFEQDERSEPTQVEVVQLSGNVDVQAALTDANLVRLSIEELKLPHLQIFVQPQTIRGAGPGSLLSRRFGSNSSSNSKNGSTRSDSKVMQCIILRTWDNWTARMLKTEFHLLKMLQL